MLDRVTCFVEEFTIHCLKRSLTPDITVTEIPHGARVEVMPERPSITPVRIAPVVDVYHATSFEET